MQWPLHRAVSFRPEKFPFTVLIRYGGAWSRDEIDRLRWAMGVQPVLHTHSDHPHIVILRRVRPWNKLVSALRHARFKYMIVRGVDNPNLPFRIELSVRETEKRPR